MQRVLVTGAGGSAGNNVCWSLRVSKEGKNLVLGGTDSDRTSLELNGWIDNAYQLPPANSLRYLSKLNDIIRGDDVELVYPQPDSEVGRLSKDRDNVKARMFLPDHRTVDICQDKYVALVKWSEQDLRKKPIVLSPRSRNLKKLAKEIDFPCWVRARHGAGGSLSCLAKSWASVEYWIDYHWSERLRTDFVVEEYLPNRDYCFMSIWNGGTLVTSMARERLSWVGHRIDGAGGTSKLNRVVHSDKVNNAAVAAIRAISDRPHGIFCVDLKEDRKNVPRPTEINCRFTTNVHYLTLASLKMGRPAWNFPWIAAKVALGEKIPGCKALDALPIGLWFTKNTDMGFTMVKDNHWRAKGFS